MGKLIVIEGLDGSGKGTQGAILFEKLKENFESKPIFYIGFDNGIKNGKFSIVFEYDVVDENGARADYAIRIAIEMEKKIKITLNGKVKEVSAIEKDGKKVEDEMNLMRVHVNRLLPRFCQVAEVEVVKEEFEKTPKRSIKRYLYK